MTSIGNHPITTPLGSAGPGQVERGQAWRDEPSRAKPTAVLAVIGLGALAVLALWVHDTPTLNGLGDWLTAGGDVVGLLAGYGLAVLVALMARLPPLDRGIGTDRLARWHAMGGRYVVSLVVGHALLIFWGYAVAANTNVVAEAPTVVTAYPDVLMATIAGFLLLGIGIVSARAARQRMRYETWYYLHFYTYLAIAIAFSHQFANGPDFQRNLAARVAWSAMYASVGALILWYRVISPLRSTLRHRFRVAEVRRETPDVVSVYIGGSRLRELRAEPGQFFRWRFLAPGLWWSSNPYSLSGWPHQDLMRITVKDRGDQSHALSRLRPGTRVIAEGPYGAFTAGRNRRKVLLLAGGVGITPLRSMFANLPGEITLIYRASSPAEVVFRQELDAIAAARGRHVHYVLGSRAGLGYDPLTPRRLAALVPALHRHEVYVCGPSGMRETSVAALHAAGVPARRIHLEAFEF